MGSPFSRPAGHRQSVGEQEPARSRRGLGHPRVLGLDSQLQQERRRAGLARPRLRPAPAARVPSRRRRAAAGAAAGTEGGFWLGGLALRSLLQQRPTPSRVSGGGGGPRTLSPGPESLWSSDFCNCWQFGGLVLFLTVYPSLLGALNPKLPSPSALARPPTVAEERPGSHSAA